MAEDLGKKNRDFLKKFVSKDIVRKKGAYRLEEVKTEDPDQWKPRNFLQKLTPEQRREGIAPSYRTPTGILQISGK